MLFLRTLLLLFSASGHSERFHQFFLPSLVVLLSRELKTDIGQSTPSWVSTACQPLLVLKMTIFQNGWVFSE